MVVETNLEPESGSNHLTCHLSIARFTILASGTDCSALVHTRIFFCSASYDQIVYKKENVANRYPIPFLMNLTFIGNIIFLIRSYSLPFEVPLSFRYRVSRQLATYIEGPPFSKKQWFRINVDFRWFWNVTKQIVCEFNIFVHFHSFFLPWTNKNISDLASPPAVITWQTYGPSSPLDTLAILRVPFEYTLFKNQPISIKKVSIKNY